MNEDLHFSIIVPVYNRPQEIDELLYSLTLQNYSKPFEVIVVEDGSTEDAKSVIEKYASKLNVRYFFKENSGAGLSRNFGMQKATGNYYIIFDSDCIIPKSYLTNVSNALTQNFTHAFGGPDAAHPSFSPLQKAINYSMTSFLTTGGLRGGKKSLSKFQPRSFNLGLSKIAYEVTQGFSAMKIGEDIDLTFRLWKAGFETQLIPSAFVFHKRRSTLKQFFKQTFAFGKARPLLNKKFPGTAKVTYWFPSLFVIFTILSSMAALFGVCYFVYLLFLYFIVLFLDSFRKNKNILVALLSVITTIIQFFGYGLGFLKGMLARL